MLTGQNPPKRLKEIWAIRIRLQLGAKTRDLKQLRSLLEKRSHGSGDDSDSARFVADDYLFHLAILKAAHDPALLEVYEFLSIAVNETIASTLEVDIPEPDYEKHRSLIDTFESRSSDIAEKAVRNFMNFILVAQPEVYRS
ncbi:FCD domain-containing protein [Pararobbsia alpina]|uniref:GntR C-terminal domain-containing protein n=1 Tax=Pararobbsia alpina TaxID=621374 RepID=A0A6S7BQD5_9BURK|nr:FCD domain-containing protein [Pararobbsia alpina]CAB3809639.1 hypothetical protein LMG28138_06111 [Pararobbsia alpina]